VTVTPRSGAQVVRALKQLGDGERAGDDKIFHFAGGTGTIAYRPGDSVRLELPVKSGNEELRLIWDDPRTVTYQFDAANREPRIVAGTTTEPAPGVRLTPTSDSTWPRLPVLFPVLRK
jgi:hypothetical protein